MPALATCTQGHQWSVLDDQTMRDGVGSGTCPVCGRAATLTEHIGLTGRVKPEDRFQLNSTIDATPAELEADIRSAKALPVAPEIEGYTVLGELGRGGMGVVYQARQNGLNRIVALKMILAGAHADEKDLARFRSEAEAVAVLEHPNIVQIHEIGEQDGRPYFSLEFVAGGNLEAKLANRPQAPLWSAGMVETLARTVHVTHQHGIIHRDLKPANVLLTRDGTPKITDFGLCKRLEGGTVRTATNQVVGTPYYMAPEQAKARRDAIGPAIDVYALGVILYEMLTGRPPFVAETPIDTLLLVLAADPVPPRRLQPKVPRDLEIICLKCMHKEPRKRYASAAALADDLHRFLNREPILARPAPAWERAWKWARRRPTAAAVLGVWILVAAGVAGASVAYANYLQAVKAEDLRQKLLAADIALVPRIAEELADYRGWADPPLRAVAADEREMPPRRLRASLALLGRDPSQADYLGERLLHCTAAEFAVVRDQLRVRAEAMQPALWRTLHDDQAPTDVRFKAGMALSAYAPEAESWRDADIQFLTRELLRSSRDDQVKLRANLAPIAPRLLGRLQEVFRDPTARGSERIAAADALADFAVDQPVLLTRLASEATAEQYDGLLAALRGSQEQREAVTDALLALVGESDGPAGETENDRILRGQRRAGAAITLMHLGEWETASAVFAVANDAEALTQFVHRLRDRNLKADPILAALARADAPAARYALLLCLGEFPTRDIPAAHREPLSRQVEEWYRTEPDSAVHGACGWLLRQWDPKADPLDLLGDHPSARDAAGEGAWFVERVGPDRFPFVAFGPGAFRMGSPFTEPHRHDNETAHKVRLTRPFAVAEREVTRGQFARFAATRKTGEWDAEKFQEASPTDAHPVVGVTWYEAVAYCNWLTLQAGMTKADQCYRPAAKPDPGSDGLPRRWIFDPTRLGYRLPTEAEWEYACRAGTTTAYSFGNDRELLKYYGRHLEEGAQPAALLRPNLRGLSDMHGNVWEWCHDRYQADLSKDAIDPVGLEEDADGPANRVLRGGGWDRSAWHCRSAYRHSPTPDYRGSYMGFRVVRTLASGGR
jgi:formylglycine-generating enzyme required for sulfatase activity